MLADFDRAVQQRSRPESRRTRDAARSASSPADAMQPQLLQSGVPPNWHGVIFVFRSAEMRRRRAREDALVRRLWRRRVRRRCSSFGSAELRVPEPQRQQIVDDALAIGRQQPLGRHLAELRRVQADPDLLDFRAPGPEGEELVDVSRPVHLLARDRAVDRRAGGRRCA